MTFFRQVLRCVDAIVEALAHAIDDQELLDQLGNNW
jgi:hypothetical protein